MGPHLRLFCLSGHRQTRCQVEGKGNQIRLPAIPVIIIVLFFSTSALADKTEIPNPSPPPSTESFKYVQRSHQQSNNQNHRRGCNTIQCDRHADLIFARREARKRARELAKGWAIPEPIVMCESGGKNEPPNYAGASGYYQIKEWYDKGGKGAPYASEHSKPEQDLIAGRLYREQGTGPWVASESCWGGRV